MQPDNKLRLAYGLKIAALAIWAMLTIITCAGVLNFDPEGFIKWCAGALFIVNFVFIVVLFKRFRSDFKTGMQDYLNSIKK